MDCAPFVAMARRLILLCTLCSSLLHWPRLHTLLQPGEVSLTPQIGIASRPLSAEQLSMVTAQTLHQKLSFSLSLSLSLSLTKPIRHCLILPPKVEKHYSTRRRGCCYQLPRKTSVLDENIISFIVYYIVIFYRLSLLTDIYMSIIVTTICLFLLKCCCCCCYYYYYYAQTV